MTKSTPIGVANAQNVLLNGVNQPRIINGADCRGEMPMHVLRKKAFWGASLFGCVALGAAVIILSAGMRAPGEAGTSNAGDQPDDGSEPVIQPLEVHTIHPKCDPSFTMSVKAPCTVIPYEWADLEAQVAGQVESIQKAEGAPVKAGELLVRIAVPDLEDDALEKEGVVRQRVAERDLALANEAIARSGAVVAQKSIDVASAAVQEAAATQDYLRRLLTRLRGLLKDGGTTLEVVEETQKSYEAAVGGLARAQADVERARAALLEAEAKSKAANVDVQLKEERIKVAERGRDRARALVNYATITAPFDGVVIRRNVNRGSFVQNATTAHTVPLLRIERRDIVTVVMKVPDTFAPFVHVGTEAVINMSELPGQKLHGKVTRFPQTLQGDNNDHTLSVQVDLYNGTRAEYDEFMLHKKDNDLKEGPLPIPPMVTGSSMEAFRRLYPGMYGDMKLVFRHLPKVFLIPSDAIVRQGGTPYLYLAKDGQAKLMPIEMQADDQRLAQVSLLERTGQGITRHKLNGTEEVIYSNQSELTDGQPITAVPEDWKP